MSYFNKQSLNLFFFFSSGISEEFGEKETILEEIVQLMEEEDLQKEKAKREKEENSAKEIRKKDLESI